MAPERQEDPRPRRFSRPEPRAPTRADARRCTADQHSESARVGAWCTQGVVGGAHPVVCTMPTTPWVHQAPARGLRRNTPGRIRVTPEGGHPGPPSLGCNSPCERGGTALRPWRSAFQLAKRLRAEAGPQAGLSSEEERTVKEACPRGGTARTLPLRLSHHPRYSLGCVRGSFGGTVPPALPPSSPFRWLGGMVPLRAVTFSGLERSRGGPGLWPGPSD